MTIVSEFYMDRLVKIKKTLPKQPQGSSSQSLVISESQKFFSDDSVLKFIDDVVNKFTYMRKLSQEMPTFDLLPPDDLTPKKKEAC